MPNKQESIEDVKAAAERNTRIRFEEWVEKNPDTDVSKKYKQRQAELKQKVTTKVAAKA